MPLNINCCFVITCSRSVTRVWSGDFTLTLGLGRIKWGALPIDSSETLLQ
jgi:hypothetical protein